MKPVNKSSAQCAEYNKRNAEAIALGVLDAVKPTAEILALKESLK